MNKILQNKIKGQQVKFCQLMLGVYWYFLICVGRFIEINDFIQWKLKYRYLNFWQMI